MIFEPEIYCLDANVLIQAWQKYYAPNLCPTYWDILNKLGAEGRIFLPEMVNEEIIRTEDKLSQWLKKSKIKVQKMDAEVTKCLTQIFAHDESHKKLVDSIKGRSLADPWLIAHAIKENATVVTKEEKPIDITSKRIRIPNVCENMGVRCINDFKLMDELKIIFSCTFQ